jgi:hypothetical protein
MGRGIAGVRFLVGASAHNAHVQQIARALHEADALRAYMTGGVDASAPRLARSSPRSIAP